MGIYGKDTFWWQEQSSAFPFRTVAIKGQTRESEVRKLAARDPSKELLNWFGGVFQ